MAKKNTLNVSNIQKRIQANTPSGGVNVFDAVKQNKYQNTITGAIEMLVPAITSIKNMSIAVAGAIYGNKMVNESTKYTELLGSISGTEAFTTPLRSLNTNVEKWIKNSDSLVRSTNLLLSTMASNIEQLVEDNKRNTPVVQERQKENTVVDNNIQVEAPNITVEAPVIPAPIVNVEPANVITNVSTLEVEQKLSDIYDVLTIDIQDAIVNNNYKPTIDTINKTIDSIKMSIDTHLNSIESIVRTINNKDYSEFIKSFSESVDKMNENIGANTALGTAQIQIALAGINEGDIDALTKLAALKIDDSSILGKKTDLTVICSTLEQLSKLKNFEDVLDLSWIPDDVEDRFFKVLQLTNSVYTIVDDITKLDEKSLQSANTKIALLNNIDVYGFIDVFDNLSVLKDLSSDEYAWMSNGTITARIVSMGSIFVSLEAVLKSAVMLSIYSGVIHSFSDAIKSSMNDLYIVINGDDKYKGIKDIVEAGTNIDTTKFDNIDEAFNRISKLTASVIGYSVLAKMGTAAMNALIGFIDRVVNTKDGLYAVLNHLPNFTKYTKKLDAIGTLFSNIKTVAVSSAYVAVLYPLAKLGIDATVKLIKLINTVVANIDIDEKKVEDMSKKLSSFKNLLIVSAGVMLLGALTGTFILANLPALLGFTAALAGFIMMTVGAYNVATKNMSIAMSSANEFAKLLAVSSMLLFVGALTGGYIASNIVNIALFTGTLSAFVFAVVGTYNLATKGMKEAISSASEFNKLLVVSAGILILAGTIMSKNDIGAALGFGVVLTLFVFGISYVYKYIADNINMNMLKKLDMFNDLVITSSLIMMTGAILMTTFPQLYKHVLGFGVLLGVFIWGVTAAYTKNTKGVHQALRQAPALAALIAVSSVILVAAAFIMKDWTIWLAAAAFGALLSGFIWLVTKAYTNGSKDIAASFLPMIALTTLVAISGAVLIAAGKLMTLEDVGAALVFGGVLAAFVVVMGFTAKLLGSFARNVGIGLLVMAGIVGIVAIAGLAFGIVAETVNKFGGPNAMTSALTTLGIAVAGLVGIAGIVGIPAVAGVVALGEVVLAGLVGIVYGVGKALESIASAMHKIKDVNIGDVKPIKNSIVGFVSLIDEFAPFANPLNLVKVKGAATTIAEMGESLTAIATVTQAYASMNIPIFQGTEIVGYKKMSNNDFKNASTNIATVLTTIAKSVSDTYDMNPELFEKSGGFFGIGGKTKFDKVCASCKSLSSMLSEISEAVRDYAELTVKQYDANGKVIGYRSLSTTDFTLAATNIREIITTLGQAIIDTYNGNEEMFETSGGILGFGSKSVFTKVCISCEAMGEMLAGIAKNVQEYAQLTVPVYSNGQVVGKRVLNIGDFKDAAQNVSLIIETLGSAIINTYNKNTEMFETTGGILGFGSKSVFTKVCISCEAMGEMLAGIAKNVQEYAQLTVPVYDANGKEVGKRVLSEQDFTDAGNNVRRIITTLGESIVATYNMNPLMFETSGGIFGFGSKSVFTKVCVSCSAMGDMISKIADGVRDYAELNIPVYDENGKIIERKPLKPTFFTDAAKNIATVVTTLGTGLMNAFEDKKEWFEDDSWFGDKPSSTPFGMMIVSLSEMGKMISSVTESVKQFALGQIPVYDKDGKIKEYVTVSQDSMTEAAGNIAKIICALGTGLMVAFGEHPEWFTDDSWFGKKAERTPFGMLITSTTGMGKLISEVAQAIVDVSNMTYVDPITNEKKTIDKTYIDKAGETVKQMFGALFGSLKNVYDDYEDNVLDDDGEVVELINKCITSSTEMLNILSGALTDLASIEVAGKKMDEVVITLPAVMKNMMLAIPTAIKDTSKDVLAVRKQVPTLVESVSSYKELLDAYADCWNVITGFYNDNTVSIIENLGTPNNRLNQMLKLICESCNGVTLPDEKLVSNIDSLMSTFSSIIDQVANTYTNNVPKLFEADVQQYANLLMTDASIKNSINALTGMFKGVPTKVNTSIIETFRTYDATIDEIVSIYNNIGTTLRSLGNEMFNNIQTVIPKLNDPIIVLVTSITNNKVDIDSLEEYNKNFLHLLTTVTSICELVNIVKKIDAEVLTQFTPLFESYIAAVESIQYLGNIDMVALESYNKNEGIIDAIVNSILRMNAAIANKDFSNIVNFEEVAKQYRNGVVMMAAAYEAMSNMHAESLDNIISDLFDSDDDIFTKALKGVNDTLSQIEHSQLDKFDREVADLDKFTQTVNTLDLNKANTMIHLTESLNQLANNMGNLDGLTESIAVKLTGVLDRLVTELGSTKETFKTAERIQKSRHEHISKSIKEMESLINKPMLIEVAPKKEETEHDESYQASGATTKQPTPQGGTTTVRGGSGVNITNPTISGGGSGSDLKFGNTTNNNYTTYNTENRTSTPNVRGNHNNVSSNVRSIVRSVFEEMIMKYNLDGNRARGNGRPS